LRFLLPLPSEPALYILLTFQVPKLTSIFCRLGRSSEKSVQVRGFLWSFVNKLIFYSAVLAPWPTHKLRAHPSSAIHDCLFTIFAATLHIWRPSPSSATWGRTMPWWQGNSLNTIWKSVRRFQCQSR
jgi:hypothetical protein